METTLAIVAIIWKPLLRSLRLWSLRSYMETRLKITHSGNTGITFGYKNYCWLAIVFWYGYCLWSCLLALVLRHFAIATPRNCRKNVWITYTLHRDCSIMRLSIINWEIFCWSAGDSLTHAHFEFTCPPLSHCSSTS